MAESEAFARQNGSNPASPGTLTMNSRYLGGSRNLGSEDRKAANKSLSYGTLLPCCARGGSAAGWSMAAHASAEYDSKARLRHLGGSTDEEALEHPVFLFTNEGFNLSWSWSVGSLGYSTDREENNMNYTALSTSPSSTESGKC